MTGSWDLVVLGLSLSSSWGNGHATTYRALLRGLAALGQRVLFLEREAPWYSAHCDLPEPDFCELAFYRSEQDLRARFGATLAGTPSVMIGSYVPDGVAIIDCVRQLAPGTLAFYDIDTPVTLAKLERGEEDYLARHQIPLFDLYLSFTGGPTLRRLELAFGAPRARPLYCAVEETLYRPDGRPRIYDLGYLGTYSPDRQPALERLLLEPARRLPEFRFVVAGPQYPADIRWPGNVKRIEHLPPAAHPAFYNSQSFTLNVTRADMVAAGWSPSVRLFEAGACGTPVISDRWPGLDSFFPPGEAILLADSADEVVDWLRGMPRNRRAAIGQAARESVLASHTGRRRAAELIEALADVAACRTLDPLTLQAGLDR